MIKLGQEVQFKPMDGIRFPGCSEEMEVVTGKVVYINEPHHWFSVVYGPDDEPIRTSFHFCEIGAKVTVL